ncbi:MarR family winged helix-turn-helix transcriptional regulator [Dehalobacterium formicoaceticum]|uniref:Winged helix DNA-binding protein n=1 Tax=Dehalobacterium formicoaceticum TaxID=51515 RepID=A0ABT1Y050_9FIRM|nr:winged helix DNA-binding protein [Dehalobacterium formicoaceticum]MCR6544252.1 winged helix DNA-binding protein [Dehalobacterium formicoaceticum]
MKETEKMLAYIDSYYDSYYRIDYLYYEWAADHGIKDTTLFVLHEIYMEKDECTQKNVTENLGYPKQTVSFVMNKLERQGIITRKKMPLDQRNNLVKLTEEGEIFASKMIREMKKHEIAAYLNMTEEERILVTEGLKTLANALERSFQKKKKPITRV